ncbi:MAG: type III-B CRISPR-associated protein Cas10/Cmr2 [Fusobacterium sp. JB019]|nr:type III-B CRISPR-associated protein Cas10/Cmr2 [Fusobacterium sp. JB019]
MTKYIGATIGPIFATLMEAKTTKEMWGSSYLFSYIMKKIIEEIKEKEFLIPYKGTEYLKKENQAGLYHDRFIIKLNSEEDFDDIIKAKEKIFENLAEAISEENIVEYLNKYIKFNIVEVDVKEDENPIFKVSNYLDVLELQPQLCTNKLKQDYIMNYFNEKENNIFTEDAFGEEKDKFKIKSLPEIAIKAILDNENIKLEEKNKIEKNFENHVENDDDEAYKILSKYKDIFRKHHKYYATIRCDGDNIGKIIRTISKNKYQDFSENLFKFSENNVKLINTYGGLTIYAGGDDLLLFAPIINGEKNIFTLIEEISDNFQKTIKREYDEILKEEERPTLSFGVDIRYYKDSMSKSISESANMLFVKAKKYEGKYKESNAKKKENEKKDYEKNAIGIKVNKHSGSEIEFVVSKEKGSFYTELKNMLNINYENNLLKSMIYTLEEQIILLEQIINNEEKIEEFFNNKFKKECHENLDKIKDLFKTCKKDEDIKTSINILKFMAFLSEKGGEE